MSVIYIAGPISLGGTSTDAQIDDRVAVFARWAENLRLVGHEVLNPCEIAEQDSAKPWSWYMRHCLPMVCRADLVAVLPDWEQSRGALLEAFVANQLGIPVVPVEQVEAA